MQNSIILVVEQLALALGGDFKVRAASVDSFVQYSAPSSRQIYLPKIIPQILLVCMQDTSPDRLTTLKVSTVVRARV